jgi:hypothetical protein
MPNANARSGQARVRDVRLPLAAGSRRGTYPGAGTAAALPGFAMLVALLIIALLVLIAFECSPIR